MALKGVEVKVDLNEDSWARDYFIIFFHTRPNDPVSTSILRSVDAVNETLPCKVVGVSMDTTTSIFDWLDSNPDLKEFNVPLMSDRDAEISRAFGVIQRGFSAGQMLTGFPANSVFIVDSEDRVRHHTVLDPRVGWNLEEVARLVSAFRSTDGGQGLAMSGWQSAKDTVENKIPSIANFYMTVYGVEEEANVTFVPMQSKGKQDVGTPGGWRVTQRANFGAGDQMSSSARSRCSDCLNRNCVNCPDKDCKTKCSRCKSDKCSDCNNCLEIPAPQRRRRRSVLGGRSDHLPPGLRRTSSSLWARRSLRMRRRRRGLGGSSGCLKTRRRRGSHSGSSGASHIYLVQRAEMFAKLISCPCHADLF